MDFSGVDSFESSPSYGMIGQANTEPPSLLATVEMITDTPIRAAATRSWTASMVSSFMLSRRRSPTAAGKPSFTYFKVDYLPDDVWGAGEAVDLDIESPRLDGVRKI